MAVVGMLTATMEEHITGTLGARHCLRLFEDVDFEDDLDRHDIVEQFLLFVFELAFEL
jgi:hypothetical protein